MYKIYVYTGESESEFVSLSRMETMRMNVLCFMVLAATVIARPVAAGLSESVEKKELLATDMVLVHAGDTQLM